MASLPGTQKQVKREVIDVEDYFGDGEVEITGYRQSPAVRSAPRSGRKVKTKEVIEILDDEEEESMLVDPLVDIRGRSVASSRQIQGREIEVSGGRKAGTSKVVVEVPSVRSILKHVNHHGLENVESDDEGSIDYNTWMGKGEVKMDVDDVQDESTFLPSAFELDDVKPETLVRERQRVRIAEKFMSRPASSNLIEQRASRFPRLWNLSNSNPFSTQSRHPDDFGVPFTNPGNRTTHIWNPKRRVAFRSSLTVPSLHLVERYKKTSGTVTKIVQSHGFIAVASATSGGSADPPNNSSQERPQIDPYNEDGNLVVWTGREFCKVKAHERTWFGPAEGGASPAQGNTKFYTVNDVAFDPLRPTRLFSTGNDCALRVWDIKQTADSSFEIPQSRSFNYPNAPNDIAFKPKSSVLAVGCYDGSVYVHHDGMNSDPTKLAVADKSSNHRTGAFLWGGDCEKESGRLHNMLFALSEADIEDEVCRHVALDVTTSKAIYTFSCTDSGDAIALDDRSESLAIITRAYNRFTLSMYDVSRHDARKPTALTEIALSVPGSSTQAVEHTFASFSPDGILLALGRSDNVALIYDVRFLSKSNSARPVTFRHHSRELTAGFGITGLRWVEGFGGRSLGLLTAGSDGCVRLWDTAQAPQSEVDNTLIAELNHDVACFSLGDSSKREQRLVVADCGGDVYVYN